MLLTVAAALILAAIVFVGASLKLNRVPLGDPPGLRERIATYLNRNVAQTRTGHRFAELESRSYSATPAEALRAVGQALDALGYEDVTVDVRTDQVSAVAVTPVLRFRDDIRVDVEARGGRVLINARSASRVGKGDLGANTRHVLDLFDQLNASLQRSVR